jgi:hypothetical protein
VWLPSAVYDFILVSTSSMPVIPRSIRTTIDFYLDTSKHTRPRTTTPSLVIASSVVDRLVDRLVDSSTELLVCSGVLPGSAGLINCLLAACSHLCWIWKILTSSHDTYLLGNKKAGSLFFERGKESERR